jgi:hypothetical protein
MACANELLPEKDRYLANVARERIVGVMIANALALLEWQVPDINT